MRKINFDRRLKSPRRFFSVRKALQCFIRKLIFSSINHSRRVKQYCTDFGFGETTTSRAKRKTFRADFEVEQKLPVPTSHTMKHSLHELLGLYLI
jgi:hypothetical protein